MQTGLRLIAATLLAASLVIGQQVPALPPVIVPGPHIVSLTVEAFDAHGKFVPNLSAGDFRISDDGKPQTIVGFQALDPANRSLRGPLKTGEYTNRSAPAASTVILFDLFNADLTQRGLGTDEIVDAVNRVESPANVYVYLLTSTATLYPVHGLPAGADAAPDPNWPGQVRPLLDDAIRKVVAFKTGGQRLPMLRVEPTWKALESLASSMASIPGRKNFIWITEGVQNAFHQPGGRVIFDTAPLRRLAAEFNETDTVAYAVQQRSPGALQPSATGTAKDTLVQFTGLTGGETLDTDDTARAIRDALRDSRDNYRIVYVPPANGWNGKYHRIRVGSPRTDLHFQTKDGYYAVHEIPSLESEYTLSLNPASHSVSDDPEIGLDVAVLPDDTNPKARRFQIRIDPSDVLFLSENGAYKAQLVLTFVAYADGGAMGWLSPIPLVLNLTPDDYRKVMMDGIRYTEPLTPSSRVRKIRLVVTDTFAHMTGSVTMQPDPGKSQ